MVEPRLGGIGAAQIGAVEVAMGEVGAGEIGAFEISAREDGKAKHHARERSCVEIDRAAIGGPELTFAQLQSDAG